MKSKRRKIKYNVISQEYKQIERGTELVFNMYGGNKIIADEAIGYTRLYISQKAHVKPRRVHEINKITNEAMKDYDMFSDYKPHIVIVSLEEITVYGKYDAISNTVYYVESVLDISDNIGGKKAVIYHEMWHCKQALDYISQGNVITIATYSAYIDNLNESCKKKLDEMGINRYNVIKISEYAFENYMLKRFDEVDAELNSLKKIGGFKNDV